MSDSQEAALGVVVLMIGFAFGGTLAVRLWRDRPAFNDPAALARMGKPATARAFRRMFPVTMIAVALLILAFASRAVDPGAIGVTACLMLLAGLAELAAISIALLNRPKALVPPHLRSEAGYLTDRRHTYEPS